MMAGDQHDGSDLRRLLKEFVALSQHLQLMSQRNFAIVATADLDQKLSALLSALFIADDARVSNKLLKESGPLGSLSSRIDLGFMLGILSPTEHKLFHCIREIRNECAHAPQVIRFTDPKLSNVCAKLNSTLRRISLSDSESFGCFIRASLYLLFSLHHRKRNLNRMRPAEEFTDEERNGLDLPSAEYSNWLPPGWSAIHSAPKS